MGGMSAIGLGGLVVLESGKSDFNCINHVYVFYRRYVCCVPDPITNKSSSSLSHYLTHHRIGGSPPEHRARAEKMMTKVEMDEDVQELSDIAHVGNEVHKVEKRLHMDIAELYDLKEMNKVLPPPRSDKSNDLEEQRLQVVEKEKALEREKAQSQKIIDCKPIEESRALAPEHAKAREQRLPTLEKEKAQSQVIDDNALEAREAMATLIMVESRLAAAEEECMEAKHHNILYENKCRCLEENFISSCRQVKGQRHITELQAELQAQLSKANNEIQEMLLATQAENAFNDHLSSPKRDRILASEQDEIMRLQGSNDELRTELRTLQICYNGEQGSDSAAASTIRQLQMELNEQQLESVWLEQQDRASESTIAEQRMELDEERQEFAKLKQHFSTLGTLQNSYTAAASTATSTIHQMQMELDEQSVYRAQLQQDFTQKDDASASKIRQLLMELNEQQQKCTQLEQQENTSASTIRQQQMELSEQRQECAKLTHHVNTLYASQKDLRSERQELPNEATASKELRPDLRGMPRNLNARISWTMAKSDSNLLRDSSPMLSTNNPFRQAPNNSNRPSFLPPSALKPNQAFLHQTR